MLVLAATLSLICGGGDSKSTLFLGPAVARNWRRTRRRDYAHFHPFVRKYVRPRGPLRAFRGGVLGFPPSAKEPTQNKPTKPSKPPRNRRGTATKPPMQNAKPDFFRKETITFSFVKEMFGFAVTFGGPDAVSWRFRGGFVALSTFSWLRAVVAPPGV